MPGDSGGLEQTTGYSTRPGWIEVWKQEGAVDVGASRPISSQFSKLIFTVTPLCTLTAPKRRSTSMLLSPCPPLHSSSRAHNTPITDQESKDCRVMSPNWGAEPPPKLPSLSIRMLSTCRSPIRNQGPGPLRSAFSISGYGNVDR